ncbi:putative lipoprotein [[Actinomadura] parvosata subsp. kistnae]|uniref:Lipoprotein n=1 Tax=[Actinomadura] parvosata subsp. kistnae TaxID=1909395 RepID=A0A1V0A093_9ACTN|nr:hypothetical protein [Nonomuraea sp. ATCC 55076]AQZ63625.1 hypothetical protein BKM31_21110 [Nonomuraea sp. ATCC 55076]SPL99408.1 putative lipoprotein [Actinomadura parvosata subsp. kistnae]
MAGFSHPRPDRGAAPAVLTLALASVLALTGCGGQAHAGHESRPAAGIAAAGAQPQRTYTVEQLAATIGCTARITLKALDYRQGECVSDGIPYVFLDFDTAAGQREWLDYAEMYGGLYLVGDRWALSAKSKSFMQELSKRLGGTVEEHGAARPGPSHSPH